VKEGDAQAMEKLFAAGFDANFVPTGETSVLGVAVSAKNQGAARRLLEQGADVERQDGFYQGTAIMFAAGEDDIEMVDLLLKHGAQIDGRDGSYGDSAINWASYSGHFDMVKHLLGKGADPRIIGHGNALEIAMRRGFQPIVEMLAVHMGETRELSPSEAAMSSAIESGAEERFRAALQAGAVAGSLDRFRRPVIATAARLGRVEMVRLLAAAGAEVDALDPIGYTALMEAARDRQVDSVRLLLRLGADVNHVSKEHGLALTPLHLAAIGGSVEVVELLVKQGAKMDVKCTLGTTPLLWGLFEGSLEAGIRLIELGADPTIATKSGYDAKKFASDNGHDDLTAAIAAWHTRHSDAPASGRSAEM
jgi:ankyrin repeat protein